MNYFDKAAVEMNPVMARALVGFMVAASSIGLLGSCVYFNRDKISNALENFDHAVRPNQFVKPQPKIQS